MDTTTTSCEVIISEFLSLASTTAVLALGPLVDADLKCLRRDLIEVHSLLHVSIDRNCGTDNFRSYSSEMAIVLISDHNLTWDLHLTGPAQSRGMDTVSPKTM